ncbi:exosome complex component MTR3-like [Ptychodera flava]|uniref:exosome complex component MTR3-like n=1 Tax=Ptychodera flava TaxID=63121 RepID=UPI00396A46F0
MPLDSRRINGPPESFPVSNFGGQITQKRLVVTDGRRQDGRKATDVRPIFLRAGVVSNAKGSAYIETKNTKVICAVYGPRQVVRREDFKLTGTLKCEFKLTTFSCKQRQQHQQSVVDKDVSLTLQQALEPAVCLDKYPRAQIDIFISVLQNDGGVLGASITCASVALADAGIDMFDVVVGCTLRQAGEVAILDPTYEEEYDSKDEGDNNGSIVVGLLPSMNQISVLIQSGDLDNEVSQQGIRSCIEGCMRTYPVVRECLVKSVKTMNVGKEKGS